MATKPGRLPEMPALNNAMEVAGLTPEGADYLFTRFSAIVTAANLADKHKPLLKQFAEFAKQVKFKYTNVKQPWKGEKPLTEVDNLQINLGDDSAKNLKDVVKGKLHMNVAISEKSEIIRSYLEDGNKVSDREQQILLDTLLNTWLSEEGIFSKDGVLYEKGEDGRIKKDKNGLPVKVDPDKAKTSLDDPARGFEAYLKDKGYDATVQRRNFPGEKTRVQEAPAQKEPATAQKEPEVTSQNEPQISTEKDIEPQQPTTPGGSSSSS